jgi:hypothetical protein
MTEAETRTIINDIKDVFEKITEYSEKAQWDLFLSCYDSSSTFLHFSGDGQMRNFDEYKIICSEYYNALKEQKIITNHLKIHVVNTNLVVLGWAGNIIAQFKNGDTMKLNKYAITNIFKKIGNDWKVIHAHESSLPPEIIKNR